MTAVEDASPEAWHALSMQLWETLAWVGACCETEIGGSYDHKLMSSPLVIRMIETAIKGDSDNTSTPSNAYMMQKVWIAWSLAPPAVQETLAPLVSMFKRVAYQPQGLGPNELWIDDDGTVLYPEPPVPRYAPPPPSAQTQTKYPYQNPPLQQQGGVNLPVPTYPPTVSAADMAQANLDLMHPHGPEHFYG